MFIRVSRDYYKVFVYFLLQADKVDFSQHFVLGLLVILIRFVKKIIVFPQLVLSGKSVHRDSVIVINKLTYEISKTMDS